MFPGFRGVHGNPAIRLDIELRPAVIPRHGAVMLILGQRETDLKSRGNAGRAHHTDQQRVKIGAVAALGGASPDGIPVTPARAGLVVTQGGDDVVVNGAGLGERVRKPVSLLRRKLLNGSLEGNEAVGLDRKSTRLNSSHQIISYAV